MKKFLKGTRTVDDDGKVLKKLQFWKDFFLSEKRILRTHNSGLSYRTARVLVLERKQIMVNRAGTQSHSILNFDQHNLATRIDCDLITNSITLSLN